jgi:hypothetical protein
VDMTYADFMRKVANLPEGDIKKAIAEKANISY